MTEQRTIKFTRRRLLQGAGITVVALAGGVTYRAVDNGMFSVEEGAAFAPWSDWQAVEATPLGIIHAAILAANPHNTQPWLFTINDDQIELHADTARNLGVVDPFRREMHTGLGCALGNMLVAAPPLGYTPDLAMFPGLGTPTTIARLTLHPADPVPNELFSAIPQRRTNRAPYDTGRAIDPVVLDDLSAAVDADNVRIFWQTGEAKQSFADATLAATRAIVDDEAMSQASYAWERDDWDDVQRYRDGITLDAAGLNELSTVLAKILPPLGRKRSHEYWYSSMKNDQLPTAAAFGVIAVRDLADMAQVVQAGITWQQTHLRLTVLGLAAQPVNQIPERRDRELALGLTPEFGDQLRTFVENGWSGLMAFRLGYPGQSVPHSPRRAVEDVVT